MDISRYYDDICRLWPDPGEAPANELVDICEQAVAEHPESSTFWHNLGIVMQRCSEDHGYTRDDYRRCFENAVRCDSANAEAYQELGYVLDVYFAEYDKAEQAMRKAIELGAGHESYYARARVLAELGRTEDALDSTSRENCPYFDHPDIQNLRTEILDGIWRPT